MKINHIKKEKDSEILENSKGHFELKILLVERGKIMASLENLKFDLQKDDIFIISPNIPYTLTSEENDSEILSLLIPSSYIEYDFENIYFENYLNDKELVSMVLEMEKEYNRQDKKSDLPVKALVCDFLLHLLHKEKLHVLDNYQKQTKSPFGEKMNGIFEYIDQNFMNEITLDSLAKQTNYCKSWLWRAFQSATGQSPMNYIKSVRLEHAKTLLVNTNLSIIEIAFKSGFPNLNSFLHMFVKKYDISPQKYRQKHKEAEHDVKITIL